MQSIWPSEPQLTTCICPPGFDGHYCQYKALDVCELQVSTGNKTLIHVQQKLLYDYVLKSHYHSRLLKFTILELLL